MMHAVRPHPLLLVVWWLWFVPALMVLFLPLEWWFALLVRGRESVSLSGVDGGGVAILGASAVPFLFGILPFLLLSSLYGFLFWRHRERGIPLGARFWVPIYGAAFILVMGGITALVTLTNEQQDYQPPLRNG
jgi:hypothetical protein